MSFRWRVTEENIDGDLRPAHARSFIHPGILPPHTNYKTVDSTACSVSTKETEAGESEFKAKLDHIVKPYLKNKRGEEVKTLRGDFSGEYTHITNGCMRGAGHNQSCSGPLSHVCEGGNC